MYRSTSRLIWFLLFVTAISATVFQQQRSKRQWGGGGWRQNQWNGQNNQNRMAANQKQYNCQTRGINLLGLPLSSYRCQTSGMSARVASQQSNFNHQGAVQGPIGGIINRFMG